LFSCSNNKNNEPGEEIIQDQTPEIFDEKSDIASISKRYEADIIQKLYQEALDKNQELNALNNRIIEIDNLKNDSLELYYKYINQNRNYYNTVDNYINMLNDSALKDDVNAIFEKLENEYSQSISMHERSVELTNTRTKMLNDRLILMKLFVTVPMMSNYQKNELPDIKTIKFIAEKYDTLIDATKPFTVFIEK
jgi:hypothetical protein